MARKTTKRRRRPAMLQGVTKQDFVAIAEVLCTTGAPSETKHGIAGYFKSQNPRFDSSRFLAATMKCR